MTDFEDLAALDAANVMQTYGRLPVAFVRGEGKVGIAASGALSSARTPACADPSAIVPAGPRKFVVACRSGSLVLYGP